MEPTSCKVEEGREGAGDEGDTGVRWGDGGSESETQRRGERVRERQRGGESSSGGKNGCG